MQQRGAKRIKYESEEHKNAVKIYDIARTKKYTVRT
jgi:hypothetical protein